MANTKNFFRASAEGCKKIPSSPVAYWVESQLLDVIAYNG